MKITPDPDLCPVEIKESLKLYIDSRILPGSFLRAILANDLLNAVYKADKDNLEALPHIVTYSYWNLPGESWGSYDKVDKWVLRS